MKDGFRKELEEVKKCIVPLPNPTPHQSHSLPWIPTTQQEYMNHTLPQSSTQIPIIPSQIPIIPWNPTPLSTC